MAMLACLDYLSRNNLNEIDTRTNIIVYGYTRQHQTSLSSTIPSEITCITLSYVDDHFMLHRGHYEWHIDSDLLQSMQTADNGQEFLSNKFKISGLNWQIQAYPNGSTGDNVGAFNLFLHLLSMPSSWKSVAIHFRFYCHETKSAHSRMTQYNNAETGWGWSDDCLALQDIQDLNIDQLTFLVFIQVLRINLRNGKQLYKYPVEYNPPKSYTFEWRIDEMLMNEMKVSKRNQGFISPLFDEMWCLKIYPNGMNNDNGVHLQYTLCVLPIHGGRVTIHWKVICEQMDINASYRNVFDAEDNNNWCYHMLSFEDFIKFDAMVFRIEIGGEEHRDDCLTAMQWEEYVEPIKRREYNNSNVVMKDIKQMKYEISELKHKMNDLYTELLQHKQNILDEMRQEFAVIKTEIHKAIKKEIVEEYVITKKNIL